MSRDKDQVTSERRYKEEKYSHYDLSSSASVFTNPPEGWTQKRYSYHGDPQFNCSFAIAYMDKSIELLKCTKQQFDDFFEHFHHPSLESLKQFLYNSIVNSEKQFYTKDIWWIIKFFKKMCNVKMVRILDETCNTVASITTEEGVEVLPEMTLSPDAGFGGSKKKSMKPKRGGAFHKPLEYTLKYYDATTPITPQTTPHLFDAETTYQNILYQLYRYNDSRISDTSRIDLHVIHPNGRKMKINMYNPGANSEELVQNGDKMEVTLRPEDPYYARVKSQTRGGRKKKRKTRRLSSV